MGNTHIIFLHIQIEYLKCESWEFESTQKHLWLIFNKCLKLAKWLHYYFYCSWSKINLRLVLIYLDRENSQLSVEIGFTQFGSVYKFKLNFEIQCSAMVQNKRKRNYLKFKPAREAYWAGPVLSPRAQRSAGGLTRGSRLSVGISKHNEAVRRCGRWI